MLASDELDFVILFSVPNLIDKLASSIISTARASGKLLAVMVAGDASRGSEIEKAGSPVILDTGRGVRALASLTAWQEWKDTGPSAGLAGSRNPRAAATIDDARRRGEYTLDEAAGKALLSLYGVATASDGLCRKRFGKCGQA